MAGHACDSRLLLCNLSLSTILTKEAGVCQHFKSILAISRKNKAHFSNNMDKPKESQWNNRSKLREY